jgi:hypothetical protein
MEVHTGATPVAADGLADATRRRLSSSSKSRARVGLQRTVRGRLGSSELVTDLDAYDVPGLVDDTGDDDLDVDGSHRGGWDFTPGGRGGKSLAAPGNPAHSSSSVASVSGGSGTAVSPVMTSMDCTIRMACFGLRLFSVGNTGAFDAMPSGGSVPSTVGVASAQPELAAVVRTVQTVHAVEQSLLRSRHRRGASMNDAGHVIASTANASGSVPTAVRVPGHPPATTVGSTGSHGGPATSGTGTCPPSVFDFCELLGLDVEVSVRFSASITRVVYSQVLDFLVTGCTACPSESAHG